MKDVLVTSLCFLHFILFQSYTYSQSDWIWQNPVPQGNDLNVIKFTSIDTGYAGGWGFAILKTTNGGTNWFFINSRIDSIPIGVTGGGSVRGIFFLNSLEGFIGSTALYKTTNGGETWVYHHIGITIKSIYFTNKNTGYVVGEDSRVFKTTDGGNNWIPYSTGISGYTGYNTVYFSSNDTGYIAGFNLGNKIILKTTNAGENWTLKHSSNAYPFVDFYFMNSNVGFALSERALFKTNNSGESWNSIFTLSSYDNFSSVTFSSLEEGYISSWKGIYKTTNSGLNWNYIYSNFLFDIDFPSDSLGFVVGLGGKIIKTDNQGLNWNYVSTSLTHENLGCVYFTSEDNGYVVGNNTILRTKDSGSNWNFFGNQISNNFSYIKFFDENTGFLGGTTLYKTQDGGVNWDSIAYGYHNQIEFINTNDAYIRNGDDLVKTTNGGVNWNLALTAGNMRAFSFENNADTGFVLISFPGIPHLNIPPSTYVKKTTNGGITWADIYHVNVYYISMYFANSLTGYLVSGMLKTTNGGVSWFSQGSVGVGNLFFCNDNVIYGTNYRSIYKTTNAGESWTHLITTSNAVSSLFFLDNNTGFATGENGMILKTTNGGGIFVNINQNEIVNPEYELYQNYPNPFNPVTKIDFELPKNTKVKLIIYDILGKEVIKLVNDEFKTAGKYSVDFNGSNLASGVYFYKLETGDFISTKRMLLLK